MSPGDEAYWRIEGRREHERSRREIRLIDAGNALLAGDESQRAELRAALDAFNVERLRKEVTYTDAEAARVAEAQARRENALTGFDALPDALPRTQCEAEVARSFGQMTDFGRCDRVAKKVVKDEAGQERVACTPHAKKVLTEGRPPWGWSDKPQNKFWARLRFGATE